MNFRIIALASCIALGSIAFGGKAQAAPVSVDVNFSGTITNTCVFGVPNAGTLAKPGALNAVEGSSGLTTGFGTGTAGSVTLDCPAGGSVVTAIPTAVVAPPSGFTPAVLQSVVELNTSGNFTSAGASFDPTSSTWTKPTIALTVPGGGVQTLNVAMIAGTNAPGFPPSGIYSYKVTLTATPN